MKEIAEELVSAFNTTITDYDAVDAAVKILEKHFKDTATPLRVNPNGGNASFLFTQIRKLTNS